MGYNLKQLKSHDSFGDTMSILCLGHETSNFRPRQDWICLYGVHAMSLVRQCVRCAGHGLGHGYGSPKEVYMFIATMSCVL